MKYKLFIIIVSYNGMKWLPKCLESIIEYPVIVVDNNSSDNTKEFIKTKFPKIILIEQNQNLGFGKANNIGISHALNLDAEYVFLLNQDAYVKHGSIDHLLNIHLNNPDYGIVSPVHLGKMGNSLEKVFEYYLKKANNKLIADLLINRDKKEIYNVQMVNAAAWLIPKTTFETVGGFHPMFFLYGEDDNYCQRVLYHGLKIGVCPEVFIIHDSRNDYHKSPEIGSVKYYKKFMNQIRIQYANVNSEDYNNLNDLKKSYLKILLKALLKLDFKTWNIYLKKRIMLQGLDFSKDIMEGRQRKGHYLNV